MKRVLLIVPMLFSPMTQAATLSWPGSAPCDTTLQACVNAAAVNDTVLIGSGAGEITTPLLIGKPLVVKSASTARARFRNTTVTIQSAFGGPGNLNVLENVQLINTPLAVVMGSNEPADEHVVELNQLDTSGNSGLTAAIAISTPQTASQKTVRIRHLRHAGGIGLTYTGAPPAVSIAVTDSQFIRTEAPSPINLVLAGSQQLTFQRNRIESLPINIGNCLSLQAFAGASIQASIDRNVVVGCEVALGLATQPGAVQLQAQIRNNTIRTRLVGVSLAGATASAVIDNNIFSQNSIAGVQTFESAQVLAAHNLYHQTAQTIPAEFGFIIADPRFVGSHDFHLSPSSPAINAALAVSIPPGGDFDGVSSSLPTIGAFNYHFGGADTHLATIDNSTSNITVIPDTLSRPFSEVLIQSIVEGFPLPAWAPNHLGVYSTTAAPLRTVIFSQNQQSIAPPRRFFVLDSNRHQTLSHTADASNISAHITYLNWAPLNGNPFANPVVVQRAIPIGGVLNNHPVGVWYDVLNSRWAIFNQDQAPMPQGAMFDVTLPTDFVSYAYTAEAANTASLDLIMDHPLLNNSPCAAVFVTPVFRGTYLPSAVHVRYRPTTNDGGRWTVLRGDGDLFQNDMDMNVYIDPVRSRACLSDGMFAGGLE